MIVVDDRLSLDALAGRGEWADTEAVTTTWGFHYRLVRALTDPKRLGRLTPADPAALIRTAVDPPSDVLVVLDPRRLTATATGMAVRHGLNVLAAELVAAAMVHDAEVWLSEGNVGRSWGSVFAAEGLGLRVVTPA